MQDSNPLHIPLRPGLDAELWTDMIRRVKKLIRGKCTLVPVLNDPEYSTFSAMGFTPEDLENTFFPIQARAGFSENTILYCVISHYYNEDNHRNRRDQAHKVIICEDNNLPMLIIEGNEIRDGTIVRNNNLVENAFADMECKLRYNIIMEDNMAQRALSLLYPFDVCFKSFLLTQLTNIDIEHVPDMVMSETGIDIQKEVFDIITELDERAENIESHNE